MEEYSHLEHVTGSPTAGESGFVHVESIDSALMDGSAINQDDGVVVTKVDNTQDDSSDLRMTDDGGNEEFVDCPDDLLSYDGRTETEYDESQEPEVATEDNLHTILPHHYQEERQQLMTELNNLRNKLKLLIKKHPLIDGNEGALFTYEHATETVTGDENDTIDKSLWPLHEVIFDCSRFIELALSEQSQTEHTVKELSTTLDIKDQEINALNVKLTEHNSVETTINRSLKALGVEFEEFPHASVSDKMSHLEKSIYFLIENRNHFFSEVEMHKRKELELVNKSSRLENEYKKLMEHFEKGREAIKMLNSEIGRLKGESEVDKTKYSNTREKLNMAVTKGKSLVQQRDSLKQQLVEKKSELDKCSVDLQEKSTLASSLQDEINRMKEDACVKIDCLIVSLVMETQEKKYLEDELADLTQKFEEVCVLKEKSVSLKIDLQRSEDKAALLREKLSMAVKKGKGLVQEREIMKQQVAEKNLHIDASNLDLKQKEDQVIKLESDLQHSKEERDQIEQFLVESNTMLQQVIDATNEIALPNDVNDPIEKVKLCAVYLNECQVSKEKVEQELEDVKNEALKTTKSLEDAEKYVSELTEEKSKLEHMKSQIQEELQESWRSIKSLEDTVSQLQTQNETSQNNINLLESEMKKLKDEALKNDKNVSELTVEKSKLEYVKRQIEEELQESWRNIKSLEDTVSQLQTHNEASQNNINLLQSEMEKLKDESLKSTKSLEDALSVSEKNVSELTEEKSKLEKMRNQIEEELQESCKTIKSLEDTVSNLQTNVSQFSHENERSQSNIESEMKKLKEEVAYHEQKFMDSSETIKTLEHTLMNSNNTVSNLLEEKKNTEYEMTTLNLQLSACRQELDLSNQILTDEFMRFTKFIEDLITSLLIKLEGISNNMPITIQQAKSLQKSINNLLIDKHVQENKIVTMSTTVQELQAELDETRSTYEKVKEENVMLQNRVSKVETESQIIRDEMAIKLKEYQAKEEEWNRREAEFSKKFNDYELEISEVEDQVSIGNRSRSSRMGSSNDHFALDIEQESDHLIDNQETVQDKGHVFKSLHTSGLVPPQGKVIADRLDGIWVSGGGALMSRPRARLGVIAYCVVLHLWLVGTLL